MSGDLYDDPDMPLVDVVRVEPMASPWGDDAPCWAITLTCGCVLETREKGRAPKRARCMGVHRRSTASSPTAAQLDLDLDLHG